MGVILLILAIIAFLQLSGLAGGVIITIRSYRKYKRFKSDMSDFFIAQDKDGYTQFSRFITDFSEAAAIRVGENVRHGINGSIGGMMKGVSAEIEAAAAEASPAHAVMASLPKSAKKNKLLMSGLEYFLNKKFGVPGQGSGGNGEFKLPEQGGLKL